MPTVDVSQQAAPVSVPFHRQSTAPPAHEKPTPAPDPAYACYAALKRMCELLPKAIRQRERQRKAERRWGEPRLFFFHRRRAGGAPAPLSPRGRGEGGEGGSAWNPQVLPPHPGPLPRGEREKNAPHPLTPIPSPPRGEGGKSPLTPIPSPLGGEGRDSAWDELLALAADLLPPLLASAEVRHLARALPGLRDGIDALAGDHPALKDFADLLRVADDLVLLVRHPESGCSFRVLVRGVADCDQLHVLLADALIGSPFDGWLPGEPIDPRVVDAYRGNGPAGEDLFVEARFVMMSGHALRPDGGVPEGFAGSDHWLWGRTSPGAIPVIGGERVVLLAAPPYRRQWDVEPRFPTLKAEVDVIERSGGEAALTRAA